MRVCVCAREYARSVCGPLTRGITSSRTAGTMQSYVFAHVVFLSTLIGWCRADTGCRSDAECRADNAGVCWRYVDGRSTCGCGPGTVWAPDLGACELLSQSMYTPTNYDFNATPLYYGDPDSLDRYSLVPVWPSSWTCDGAACSTTDPEEGAWYRSTVSTTLDPNVSNVLRPSDVALWCGFSRRFTTTVAYAPSRAMEDRFFQHNNHCVDCAAWCGAHGICINATSFECACDLGYVGERCGTRLLGPVAGLLAAAMQGAAYPLVQPVFTAEDTLLAAIRDQFPFYQLGRACVLDADCGNGERCWVNVSASMRLVEPQRSCFCDTHRVPSETRACATVVYFPVFGISVGGYPTVGVAVGPLSQSAALVMTLTLNISATAVTARAVEVDPETRAFSQLEPVLLRCAVPTNVSFALGGNPVEWCLPCATRCNGGTCSTGGVCTCPDGKAGPRCANCTDATMLAPSCAVSVDTCRASSCSSHGYCSDSTGASCVCDTGYVGATCNETAVACGFRRCTVGHGVCVADGVACDCEPGWTGAACAVPAQECRARLCSGKGDCGHIKPSCACDVGTTSANCASTACNTSQTMYGTSDGRCVCKDGFTGTWCETSVCGPYGVYVGAGNGTDGSACACEGILLPNADGVYPVCSADRCGGDAYGQRVTNHLCQCRPGTRYNPTGVTVCVPGLQPRTASFLDFTKADSDASRYIVYSSVLGTTLAIIAIHYCGSRKK